MKKVTKKKLKEFFPIQVSKETKESFLDFQSALRTVITDPYTNISQDYTLYRLLELGKLIIAEIEDDKRYAKDHPRDGQA